MKCSLSTVSACHSFDKQKRQCFATHRRVRTAAFRRIKELDGKALSEELRQFLFGLQRQWLQKGEAMSTALLLAQIERYLHQPPANPKE